MLEILLAVEVLPVRYSVECATTPSSFVLVFQIGAAPPSVVWKQKLDCDVLHLARGHRDPYVAIEVHNAKLCQLLSLFTI